MGNHFKTVVSMVGMEHNPASLLRRAEYLVGLSPLANTLADLANVTTDLQDAVNAMESLGLHVVGHVSNETFHYDWDDYGDPDRRVQVRFQSAVQPNAYATLVVSEPEVGSLVEDFMSSGHWYFKSAVSWPHGNV